MLIYSHSTPDILTATIRSVDDVKNSEYCGLVGPNFPEDVMALDGDNLVIADEPDKLNREIAVAIAFNSVQDCESAKQFVRLFLLNAPTMDVATILYYKDRISNGPFADCVGEYSQAAIEASSFGVPSNTSVFGGSPRDTSFLNTLKNALLDCLNAPCDYFNGGGTYGFLGMNTPGVTGGVDSPPPIDDILTFNKIPETFQQVSATLSVQTKLTMSKIKNVFKSKDQRIQEEELILAGKTPPPVVPTATSISLKSILPDNIVDGMKKLLAPTKIQNVLSANLGDCFRIQDYQRKYNPYTYTKTGGSNGESIGPRPATGIPEKTVNRGKSGRSGIDYTPPPGLRGYGGAGIATVFGLDYDGKIDSQDNGIGAFGQKTANKQIEGVSIPFGTALQWFGKDYRNYIRKNKPLVEITNNMGKTVRVPIVDLGPAAWTKNDLDLTYKTARDLQTKGKATVTYRLVNPPSNQ
jgi:hypothetical protein